jgi:hypothetical protein
MAYTTIDNPELYMQVKLYSGNSDTQAITFDGSENMQPDMMWFKGRNFADDHTVIDSVRGITQAVYPDTTGAETTQSHYMTAIGSDGFTLDDSGIMNRTDRTYVAWCWKESATAGFDIVTYTGNGTDDTDISHNLSAVPKMIIIKNRDAADDWQIYHAGNTSSPETDYLVLNENDATADNVDRWSDEAPTSSVFTLGDADEVNTDTEDYIAYCFAEKQGFSKVGGSYTGNGDVDGPFIYTGFKPAFFLTKRSDVANAWVMFDNKRDSYNEVTKNIYGNTNEAEETDSNNNDLDFLSNGIKIREDNNAINADGGTYIYMAFAEAPFVNSGGVPANAR